MPSPSDEWNARSAASWHDIVRSRSRSTSLAPNSERQSNVQDKAFHPAMNAIYEPPTPQPGLSAEVKTCLGLHDYHASHDSWSCFALLCGISTVVWDSQRAEPMRKYATFDTQILGEYLTPGFPGWSSSSLTQTVQASVHMSCQSLVERSKDASSASSRRLLDDLLFLIDVRIFADVVTLQMASGLRTIAGGSPSAPQANAAWRNISTWAEAEESELAVALSVRYLSKYAVTRITAVSLLSSWAMVCAAMCLHCHQIITGGRSSQTSSQTAALLMQCREALMSHHCTDGEC